MGKSVQIQIGEYRSVLWCDLNDVDCSRGDSVIIQVDRGQDFGRMISDKSTEFHGKQDNPHGKIIRKATEGDVRQIEHNRMKARDAIDICVRKISDRKIKMQIVKAEYTFDCSKIIFFFTAEGRVDFRGLVKDLARIYRVRIELKQIGVRDKSKIIGGYGVCGERLCCISYMKSFHPLSIKMAKEQDLPLNPSRISGVCGRIKCCMAYEFQVYREHAKGLPKMGERISTPEGKGKVVSVNILKRSVRVDCGEGKMLKLDYSKIQKSPEPKKQNDNKSGK